MSYNPLKEDKELGFSPNQPKNPTNKQEKPVESKTTNLAAHFEKSPHNRKSTGVEGIHI